MTLDPSVTNNQPHRSFNLQSLGSERLATLPIEAEVDRSWEPDDLPCGFYGASVCDASALWDCLDRPEPRNPTTALMTCRLMTWGSSSYCIV